MCYHFLLLFILYTFFSFHLHESDPKMLSNRSFARTNTFKKYAKQKIGWNEKCP
jgi:hypothetical protein